MGAAAQARPMTLEASATTEPDDLAELFRRFRLRAFHFALQMLGNREDAMDVTQEAFLRLHRHWHRRDAGRPVAPWLYAVVRNLAIDSIRKRAVRKEEDAEAAPVEDFRPGPEILSEQNELRAEVWKAIGELPAEQREIVILREFHGLSYAEIAEVLGAPHTTVTTRLHHARERLRKRLEGFL
jgi:RNA polymerase sigma-70 factor (ECF subfamily)